MSALSRDLRSNFWIPQSLSSRFALCLLRQTDGSRQTRRGERRLMNLFRFSRHRKTESKLHGVPCEYRSIPVYSWTLCMR